VLCAAGLVLVIVKWLLRWRRLAREPYWTSLPAHEPTDRVSLVLPALLVVANAIAFMLVVLV
jgi:hypothetical protein